MQQNIYRAWIAKFKYLWWRVFLWRTNKL